MKRTLNLPGSNVTSTFTSRTFTIVFLAVLWLLGGCGLLNDDDPDGGSYFPRPVYPSAYSDPSVTADGELIVFRRMKITRIDRSGAFWFDSDSTGIWMIRADGTGMRFLMQGVDLYTPVLSPDGKWLAYVKGAQIFKVPFDGHAVDNSGVVQLTREGRNFYPAWSPDGKWLAFGKSICEGPKTCGIWLMTSDGSDQSHLADFANFPDWQPNGEHLLGIIGMTDLFRLYPFHDVAPSPVTVTNHSIGRRHPKYSRDGTQIAFQSQAKGEGPEVWVMQSDGAHPRQLTGYGGRYPSWMPEGRIVYVHHNYGRFDEANGTIWIMNADGSGKQQLTFNRDLELR